MRSSTPADPRSGRRRSGCGLGPFAGTTWVVLHQMNATAAESSFVRPHVAGLRMVQHGSVAASELRGFGLTPADVVDFSVNTNPLGPAAVVREAIRAADWTRYPGDDEGPLREGIARQVGVRAEQVALGNGSSELLWLIALAVLGAGDRVGILGPTFGEYARAARAVGAHVEELRAVDNLPDVRMLFVCNPNNPTSDYHAHHVIERLLSDHPRTVVVLDEAYAAFVPNRWRSEPLLERYDNLVILRSLTKDHALPGLRLGYALARAPLASAFEAVRPPWSVNAGALRAGLATLEPEAVAHLAQTVSVVAESRAVLSEGLTQLGYSVHPAAANFVLVHVGDASTFRRTLLQKGIVVRDCTSFGLPAHVRIACRLPAECLRLLDALR
jgi:histidinol-phosphate aminotransferase